MFVSVIIICTCLHFLAGILTELVTRRAKSDFEKELVLQHHEKCFMYGLIALAIVLNK